jgi:hypothetical protein
MTVAELTAAKASLETRYAAVAAELAALAVTKAGGKPDAVDGVKHQAYKDGLLKELASLREEIAAIDEVISANGDDGGVWEVVSEYE